MSPADPPAQHPAQHPPPPPPCPVPPAANPPDAIPPAAIPPNAIPPAAAKLVSDSLHTARVATETAADVAGQENPLIAAATKRLDDIADRLQHIHVSLEHLRVSLETVTRRAADHELRLRRLEQWQQRLVPVLTATTFLVGTLAAAVLGGWVAR